MKKLLIILILFATCSKITVPGTCTFYDTQEDSAWKIIEWKGGTEGWKGPIYKFWAKYYGTAYYRTSDTTIIGYNDTIIFPLITGWITQGGRPSYNWDSTVNCDGVRADGMPYWLDSLVLISYNLGNLPLVDIAFQRSMPYWMPNMLPSYIKEEREDDLWWMERFPYWPEIPNKHGKLSPRFFDSLDFEFDIGDTVEILNYTFTTYKMQFLHNHEGEPCWEDNDIFGYLWDYKNDPRDKLTRYGFGIIIDRWIEPMNGIRYYKLKAVYDYDSYYTFWRVVIKVAEELRPYKGKAADWSDAGR